MFDVDPNRQGMGKRKKERAREGDEQTRTGTGDKSVGLGEGADDGSATRRHARECPVRSDRRIGSVASEVKATVERSDHAGKKVERGE